MLYHPAPKLGIFQIKTKKNGMKINFNVFFVLK